MMYVQDYPYAQNQGVNGEQVLRNINKYFLGIIIFFIVLAVIACLLYGLAYWNSNQVKYIDHGHASAIEDFREINI